jgi:hypothetical protein
MISMIHDNHFNPKAPMYIPQRFEHDCSGKMDRPLVVTRTPKGWKYFCHRCGEKGKRSANQLSPSEWLAWQKHKEVKEFSTQKDVQLPVGFTRNIPAEGLAWLFKYGITEEDIERYAIGYSRVLNRVVLPVYNQKGKLVYYQARTLIPVTEKNPKYMNVKAQGRKDVWFKACPWASEQIVFVEDILSAIRVSHTENCIGLLYAYIPDRLILEYTGFEVILWLDPDKHNRMLTRVNRWRSFGENIKMIRSNKDPKYYTDEEIEEKLEEV